jgi:hypothetical protein
MELSFKNISNKVNTLNDLRLNQLLCDCTIKTEDNKNFLVHRIILSASSEYFRALFTNGMADTNQEMIKINGIDSETMGLIIDWIYTKNICIHFENIERLFVAADQLQEFSLFEKCVQFLEENMTYENVIDLRKLSKKYFIWNLERVSFNFLM